MILLCLIHRAPLDMCDFFILFIIMGYKKFVTKYTSQLKKGRSREEATSLGRASRERRGCFYTHRTERRVFTNFVVVG